MKRNIILKTDGEKENTIRFVVTEDSEPVFQGVFEKNAIYRGSICSVRVKDRLKSCRAAFCEIGTERPAFLNDCNLMPGKMLLAQVESTEHDAKGIRFSMDIMITGKYAVLNVRRFSAKPNYDVKVSKKVPDKETRNSLHKLLSGFVEKHADKVDCYFEVICRTSALGETDVSLIEQDVEEIFNKWDRIYTRFKDEYLPNSKCGIIDGYEDIIKYIAKHERTNDFDEIITDSSVLAHELSVSNPEFSERIKSANKSNTFDIFAVYSLDNMLAKLLRKRVYLKTGASIVVEFTEAMAVIDVNSGKNVADSMYAINVEAAAEIMRQLRLRDMGGIIVCDFINMPDNRSERLLVEYMKELGKQDPCDLYISDVSKLGIVEIARKRS